MMQYGPTFSKGFSLAETLIVLAIMSLFSSLLIMTQSHSLKNLELERISTKTRLLIEEARFKAELQDDYYIVTIPEHSVTHSISGKGLIRYTRTGHTSYPFTLTFSTTHAQKKLSMKPGYSPVYAK